MLYFITCDRSNKVLSFVIPFKFVVAATAELLLLLLLLLESN